MVDLNSSLDKKYTKYAAVFCFFYITFQVINMFLSIRYNFYVEPSDSERYKSLKISLGVIDFSLLAVDVTMTIIFITLVALDFREK